MAIITVTMATTLTTVIATMATAMATTTATATMPMMTPTMSREAMAIAGGGERRRAHDMTTTLATIRNRIEDKRRDEDKRTLTHMISAARGP